ncbi:MAG: tryptophan 7-halogenase [Chthoniobacterales bacterium]|nr:tryptophan 7-halogenase [Chthoniobacterales bacterium]
MTNSNAHDVIVIGGGPAGSTAATWLAREGHDVLLMEREKFPREHVGESLLPFCYKLLEDLGVVEELKKNFVRKPGVRFIDRDGNISTTWCFDHVIKNDTYLSFQVIRGEFDHILLKNAAKNGVDVREETSVVEADITTAPDRVSVTALDASGEKTTHTAKFLIDASGREAFIGAKSGWRKPREELDRTAIWSHWGNVKLAGGLEEGLSIIIYMGLEQKGWIWVFPLGENRITAGFVAQNSYIKEQQKKLREGGSKDWKQDLCMQELLHSKYVAGLLEGADMLIPMQINGNYSYEVKNHYGSNYAMVGDARGFIDPIFSSGVFLSIKTASLVSAALHKQLTGQVNGKNEAMEQAYAQVTGAYNFVHRMIKLFYNPHSVTWAQAGADGQAHKNHESAMAAGHYMLSGDFFENYKKYEGFFEVLEDPEQFRRYKKLVIDRDEFVQPTCSSRWEEVFQDMVARDAERTAELAPV